MKIERKFIDLKSLKVRDEGPGFIEGYRSVFGTIDEGGDIVLPGAFKDTTTRYLKKGFTAHSHDWSFKEAVGYPIEAKEDSIGYYVVSKFHSTPDAQDIRTKAKERMDDGLDVGFSFGYEVKDYEFIERKDYAAKLPLYVKADVLEASVERASAFPKIRLLKSLKIYEDSLVTAPMNEDAGATGVKSVSASAINVKGIFEDELAERTQSLWALFDVLECVICRIYWQAQTAADLGASFDADLLVREALDEFALRVSALTSSSDTASELAYSGVLKSVKGSAASVPLDRRSDAVASAAEEFARRGAVLAKACEGLAEHGSQKLEVRLKEGRTLSTATLDRMKAARDSMSAACDHLDELMSAAEPKSNADSEILASLAADFVRENFTRITL
jgi:HK97 family phage prohead protease